MVVAAVAAVMAVVPARTAIWIVKLSSLVSSKKWRRELRLLLIGTCQIRNLVSSSTSNVHSNMDVTTNEDDGRTTTKNGRGGNEYGIDLSYF
ncbi:hypothetical protein PF008_g25332 [Phytophthora fragariae]|uniref:Uncharacterized protein n=1 Tax=Phytophthora fragariae TaxID=53985 RepID=A0A6G0QK79_9STRA|nr:hypothetical protein PF008_g25332 [Phytophthora fragariae]